MIDLKTLAAEVHQQNVDAGWWDDFPNKVERFETAMMLCVSEIAEAMEGYRKDLMDDHLPQHKMFDVELADAMIRLLDLAGAYEPHILEASEGAMRQGVKEYGKLSVPAQLYRVVQSMSERTGYKYVVFSAITDIRVVARVNDVDIWPIVAEKRAYNKTRADHKLAARKAVGGKKF